MVKQQQMLRVTLECGHTRDLADHLTEWEGWPVVEVGQVTICWKFGCTGKGMQKIVEVEAIEL